MNMSDHTPEQMLFLGFVNAVQALTMAVLDDEVKRSKVTEQLERFVEGMLHSEHSEAQKKSYLDGLALLGVATTFSKDR